MCYLKYFEEGDRIAGSGRDANPSSFYYTASAPADASNLDASTLVIGGDQFGKINGMKALGQVFVVGKDRKKYAVDINDERSRRIIGKSISLGSKLNVKITLEFYEGNSNCNIPCPIPWKWAIINENGEFMPCSWISKSRCGFEVGNLRRNNFMEIWNNDRMKELRKTILDGTYSFCGKYASPNCAHLINRRIVVTAKRENQS